MRKKLIGLLLILGSLLGVTAFGVVNAPIAGAMGHPGIACYHNYHPGGAPNVKMWCGGWFQSNGFAFRVEASHHYGWWGPNFDYGRWRIIIDKHYIPTGQWLMTTVDSTFNDQIAPWISPSNGSNTEATLSFVNARETSHSIYNFTDNACINQYPSVSQYYQEHPQFWLVMNLHNCVFGNGWKQGPITLVNAPAYHNDGSQIWQSPTVKAWVR